MVEGDPLASGAWDWRWGAGNYVPDSISYSIGLSVRILKACIRGPYGPTGFKPIASKEPDLPCLSHGGVKTGAAHVVIESTGVDVKRHLRYTLNQAKRDVNWHNWLRRVFPWHNAALRTGS